MAEVAAPTHFVHRSSSVIPLCAERMVEHISHLVGVAVGVYGGAEVVRSCRRWEHVDCPACVEVAIECLYHRIYPNLRVAARRVGRRFRPALTPVQLAEARRVAGRCFLVGGPWATEGSCVCNCPSEIGGGQECGHCSACYYDSPEDRLNL
jgi:hypothetical protein